MREITYEADDCNGLVSVTRTRTSSGYAAITINFGKQRITLSNDDEDIGDNYEMMAIELGRTIEEAAINPCNLPTMEDI